MGRIWGRAQRLAAVPLVLTLMACATACSSFGPSTDPTTAIVACSPAELDLRYDPAVNFQQTSERGDAFRLVDRGPSPCRVVGYPGVALGDGHGPTLAFRVVHGTYPVVDRHAASPVVLEPGQSAYVGVAVAACVARGVPVAAARFTLPGSTAPLVVRFTSRSAVEYCTGSSGPPGNTVFVTAFEPTARRVLAGM